MEGFQMEFFFSLRFFELLHPWLYRALCFFGIFLFSVKCVVWSFRFSLELVGVSRSSGGGVDCEVA